MTVAPPLPFTFAIALTPRETARDWGRIEALLELTLASVRAQGDGDWRVRVMGHDRPACLPAGDPRVSWMQADWPVEPPGPHNTDSGRKKHALNDAVLAEGGGLLMLLDADDWVEADLVETARREIGGDQVGGVVAGGWAVDLGRLRACPLPAPGVFGGGFHTVCGSSTVARLRPAHPDPVRRDPFSTLRSHHRWPEAAAEAGVELAILSCGAAYLVGTSENHSAAHGPHGEWFAGFTAAVAAHGAPVDAAFCARFGVSLGSVQALAGAAQPSASNSSTSRSSLEQPAAQKLFSRGSRPKGAKAST